jgi:hypothetical protein
MCLQPAIQAPESTQKRMGQANLSHKTALKNMVNWRNFTGVALILAVFGA